MRAASILALAVGLAAVVASGCGDDGPDECDRAVAAAVERFVEDAPRALPAALAKDVQRMEPQLNTRLADLCRRDEWSPKVIICYRDADSSAAAVACDKRLKKGQQNRKRAAIEAVLTSGMPLTYPK